MIPGFTVPDGCEPASRTEENGVERAHWTAGELGRLADRLATGTAALRAIPAEELERAWQEALGPLLDPASEPRRSLAAAMTSGCVLSPPALDAALDAMLGGFAGEPARQLIERGDQGPPTGEGLALAIVAGNIPALAVQVVLPALAARRPLLIKSSSSEPFFAAVLLERLTALLPDIRGSIAAVSWPGGSEKLERAVLERTGRLVAYGSGATLADLRQRFSGPMVELGPKLSIAVVAKDVDPAQCAPGLAQDIALFDQRGCLSVQTIFTEGDPQPLADSLAGALEQLAESWPPQPLPPRLATDVQQLRHQAALTGASVSSLPIRQGTVVASREDRPDSGEPEAIAMRPSPGGRTVEIRSLVNLATLPERLSAWRGHIQGAALAGASALAIAPALEPLGVTRITSPGNLQRPDALWANGHRHVSEELR
jgi:hypothetical protein